MRLVILGLWFCQQLFASSIEFTGTPITTITAGNLNVPIYKEALVKVGDSTTAQKVYLTGAGVYRKKIVFIEEDVYVAASYLDTPTGITTADPLQSIFPTKLRVMYLTILRDLTPSQIRGHFEDGLDANSVDLNDPPVQRLLNQVNFNLVSGNTNLIIGTVDGPNQTLFIRVPTKEFTSTSPVHSDDFWRIWFGVPFDDEMGFLRQALIGKKWGDE